MANFLDGRLPEAERDVLERHLTSCAGCFELMTTSARALAGSVPAAVAPDAPTRVMPQDPETQVKATVHRLPVGRPLHRRLLLGSAAAAGALGLAAFGYWLASPAARPMDAGPAPARETAVARSTPAAPGPKPARPVERTPAPAVEASAGEPPAPQPALRPVEPVEVAAPARREPAFAVPVRVVDAEPPAVASKPAIEEATREPDLAFADPSAVTPAAPDAAPRSPAAEEELEPEPEPAQLAAAGSARAVDEPALDADVVYGRLSILHGTPPRLQTVKQTSPTAVKTQTDLTAGSLLKVTGGFAGIEVDGGFLTVNGGGGGSTLRVQPVPDGAPWMLDRGALYAEADPESETLRIATPHAVVTVEPGEVQIAVTGTQTQVRVEAGEATVSVDGGTPVTLGAGEVGVASATQGPRLAARNAQSRIPDWVLLARSRRLRDIVLAVLPDNLSAVERDRILQSLQRVLQRGYPVSDLAELVTRACQAGDVSGRDLAEIARGMVLAVEGKRNALLMRDRLLALLEEGVRGRDLENAIRDQLEGLPELLDSILRPGSGGEPPPEPPAAGGKPPDDPGGRRIPRPDPGAPPAGGAPPPPAPPRGPDGGARIPGGGIKIPR
jgi:hypothetical protein